MSIEMTKNWSTQPRFGFDTETTGVNPREVRLVTAALVIREPKKPDQVLTWMADPEVPIPEAAASVHGITTEQAQAEGRPIKEVLAEVSDAIVHLWESGYVMVAFNGGYDLLVLNSELSRHGLPTLEERCHAAESPAGPIADPLILDRKLDRYRKGKRKLIDMCNTYRVEPGDNLHTAEYDVIATLNVLEKILENYPEITELSGAELIAYQRQAHAEWAESFNRFLVSKGRTGDVSLSWPY